MKIYVSDVLKLKKQKNIFFFYVYFVRRHNNLKQFVDRNKNYI